MNTREEQYYSYDNYDNDQAILRGLIAGDEKALQAIINHYQSQMMIEAFNLLKDVQESEDVIQEIFIRIWEKRHSLGIGKYSSIGAYLMRATRNQCLVRIRDSKIITKRNDLFSYRSNSSLSFDPAENQELKAILRSAIDSLPPKTRSSFKKLYEEDLSQKEIARQEEVSLQTVKNTISRGLKILREKLKVLR